ncbi:MAG: flippase-like domain-containing protein [Chitinophagaceae bacterium]|nr:flippase-like domain-containing protein [Chitinophagaceae bacterium]
MNKSLKTFLQYLFFLGLGVLFVWLSLRNLDSDNMKQIRKALDNARYWLIIPVFIMLIASHLVRALRWKLLIESSGHRVSLMNSFFAVMIGYLVNQGVPRLGEVVKCTMLGRYEKVPVEKLIGTVILERIVDAFSFLAILAVTFLIQPGKYSELMNSFFSHGGTASKEDSIPGYVFLLVIIGAVALLIGIWMIWKKKTLKDLAAVFRKTGLRLWQGVSSIQHLKKRGQFILLTVTLWALYLFSGFVGLYAFAETSDYGIREAFTILSAGSIGMIASPGGIGAYAYLIQKTMPVYGMNEIIALAFGWILWLATTGVILLGGLFSFAALPYYNKKYNLEKSRPDQQ